MTCYDHDHALLHALSPARRNHYFYGKRMDVQHFQLEQDYGKHKQWLLNRLTLGKGVVCGLRTTIDGDRLCVDPGVAIDGLGREIVVPVRQCIDPLADDGGCCVPCCGEPKPPRGDGDADGDGDGANPDGDGVEDGDALRLYTLWLCYKECKTDFEPVLVSECQTRQPCAAGTIVESFCLKVGPGAPLQYDPDWCAHLWPRKKLPDGEQPVPAGNVDDYLAVPRAGQADPSTDDLRRSFDSRRRILCRLFDGPCDPGDGDPCVPLGAFMMRGRRIVRFDACLVRPRVYSNAQLLDLILCLADRIDECCNGHEEPPADPMRLVAVDFVARSANGESTVATMVNPLVDTPIAIERNINALRLRFSQAFAQDARKPTTPAPGDATFERHNVLILADDVLNGVPYVAGTLAIESADTARFDLSPDSPYMRGQTGGWQKGRYRVALRGNEDLPAAKPALGNAAGDAFDGEPIAPAGGFISGNAASGGDFVGTFVVGAGEPAETLRVRSVDFLLRNGDAEVAAASVATPLDRTTVTGHIGAIRIRFTKPLTADVPLRPTTHGIDDADFTRHNVQVLLAPRDARLRGIEYLPGTVKLEAPDTLRFDVLRGTRIVNADGRWPAGVTNFVLALRGTALPAKPTLADSGGAPLDGEPVAPAGGVISGDGNAGGDFNAPFAVVIER